MQKIFLLYIGIHIAKFAIVNITKYVEYNILINVKEISIVLNKN